MTLTHWILLVMAAALVAERVYFYQRGQTPGSAPEEAENVSEAPQTPRPAPSPPAEEEKRPLEDIERYPQVQRTNK